jgi:hypothetical protein
MANDITETLAKAPTAQQPNAIRSMLKRELAGLEKLIGEMNLKLNRLIEALPESKAKSADKPKV